MTKKRTKTSTRRAKAPDSIFSRQISAYLLIAFGILVFLAVILQMQGAVFEALRTFAFGLAGGFGFLIPLFPVWAGVSMLFSTKPKEKGSFRVPALICLLYLFVLAAAVLFTYTSYGALGRVSLMDYFAHRSGTYGAFTDMLSHAFSFCSGGKMGISGGLLGTLVAWPLWRILGSNLSGVLCILIMAVIVVPGILRVDLVALFQNLRLQFLELHNERSEERVRREEALAQRALEVKKEDMIREAKRQSFAERPRPEQFSGPHNVVAASGPQSVSEVTGFAPTPEENPNYVPRPRARRSAISRIFGDPEKNAERDIASELFPQTPAAAGQEKPAQQMPVYPPVQTADAPAGQVSGYSPEQAWQQNGSASPFQIPAQQPPSQKVPRQTAPAPVPPQPEAVPTNPHGLKGPARPAAAYPVDVQEIPEIVDPDDVIPPVASFPEPEKPAPASAAGQRRPAAWIQQTPDPIPEPEPAAAVQEDEEDDGFPDDLFPAPQQVMPPPQVRTAPSTWKPELEIVPPGDGQTFGQKDKEKEEAEHLPIPYIFPDPSLLKEPDMKTGFSPEEDAQRSRRLEETLASFKIACTVKHVTHGPTISRFELELAAGIKVSKITDLGPNIAMNMEVKSVRIEAPIPGKSLVGVEVPNRKVATVTLKEVLSSDIMVKASDPLVVALGKDIAGSPVICNLARMPHLLIAGATGSGKSVCINTIIGSLLYRTTPDQVRLILVDPKVVELQCYNGIPHLLAPVVSDPHKAAGALQWAVDEMMRRYTIFQEAGVRNLDGYNKLLGEEEKHIPRIVIIIDELADLMMTCKREVEEYICRLAQLARAAGIHLIVATQRPSVDVITGLIKANIPSRIAFKVSSFIDSRTILDKNGAEQLLGYGDMLYQPMGEFTPIRVQGCFLSDEEVNSITDFIRKTSESDYDENFVTQLSKIETESVVPADILEGGGDSGDSSLLDQCIEIALMDGQVSTSLLQRRLKIGYARAGRLVDEMEKQGIISAKDGAKPRLCLITRDEYEQMKSAGRFS